MRRWGEKLQDRLQASGRSQFLIVRALIVWLLLAVIAVGAGAPRGGVRQLGKQGAR